MTRIAELQKKYPTTPREIILHWEVMRNGVRDTDDLDKASTWRPAGAHFSYQTYDHDVTLKDLVAKKPARLRAGKILRPDWIYMSNGLGAALRVDTRSPYEIRDLGNGNLGLFEGEEKVDIDIYLIPPRSRNVEDLVTSKGTPISALISPSRQCFRILPVRYCEYFAHGEQCKFCNFNATQDDSRSIGLARPVTIDLEETIEAYKILSSELRLVEGAFEMGGLRSGEQEASIHCDFVGKIANAAPYKPALTVHTQTMDRKDMLRLKDAGLDALTIQLEVWDPKVFGEVCPGKAKHSPHERWLESFLEAVDIYGAGNVGASLVAGVSVMPENGHETWQESRDSFIEGERWMIKNGVMPAFSHVRIPPGSVYGADYQALREKLPPTEYYLDAALAHHEAMLEYGLYPKLNKFMYCAFECSSKIYSGEIGMLALAGDIGNWMADVVPSETNWLAQFVASIRKPTVESPAGCR